MIFVLTYLCSCAVRMYTYWRISRHHSIQFNPIFEFTRFSLPFCLALFLAIWLLPTESVYGDWPRSGEIDFVEGRGNTQYLNQNGEHIGVEHFGSVVHFGPSWDQNGYETALFSVRSKPGDGYNNGFHRYMMEWTPNCILFCIDGHEAGRVNFDNGFWERGHFRGANIWENATQAAPFDQYVSIALKYMYDWKTFDCNFVFRSVPHHIEFGGWWYKWIFPRSGQWKRKTMEKCITTSVHRLLERTQSMVVRLEFG